MHYLATSQSTIDQQKEFDVFLTMLSPSLKIEVTKYIFQSAIIKNPVFENRLDIIEQVLHDLQTSLFIPENEICRQGAVGKFIYLFTLIAREIYFIAKGEWEVYVTDENQSIKFVTNLMIGDYFGEVALLKDCPRTATVKSKNYSTWASLDKTKFDKLLDRYSFLRKIMENRISELYQDKLKKFIK